MRLPRQIIRKLARAGYTSRGVVYLIIGVFACLAALGGTETLGTKEALSNLLGQPFGHVLIGLMIVGLAGYVLWRLVQAVFDADDHGLSPKALAIRGGLLVSAFTYATLTIYALSRVGIFPGGGGEGGSGGVAHWLAGFVGSRPVAWALALVFIIVGGAHCWKAGRMKFEDHFIADERTMTFLRPISVIGLVARGIVFFILAFLLFYRGLNAQGSSGGTPGIKEALQFLQDLPFGWAVLGAMGIGIVLFAVYSFCEAIWRRVRMA